MNLLSGSNSTDQKLHCVTYIAEINFLENHMLRCEFYGKNVHDMENMYIIFLMNTQYFDSFYSIRKLFEIL